MRDVEVIFPFTKIVELTAFIASRVVRVVRIDARARTENHMSFTARCADARVFALGARVAARGGRRDGMRRRSTRFAPRTRAPGVATCAMRPYTVRKGDTLESIASKRSMRVEDVKKYNKSLRGEEALAPGTTILLPSEKLSKRDQQIIDGIKGVNEPRVYPCRGGETLEDIINPRKISKSEVERLNPKLGALKAGTKVLLPPGKYTVREKEMLQGCGILPVETLNPLALLGSPLARNALGAMIGVGAYAMYFAACRRYQDHGTKLWGNDRAEINDD